MKKMLRWCTLVCLVCALLFSLGLSAGADATAVPNPQYQQPQLTVNKITARPLIDGDLGDDTWKQATQIPFTQEALMNGSGQLWSHTQDSVTWEPLPNGDYPVSQGREGEGMAYIGWDEEYVFIALEIRDATSGNPQKQEAEMWKGDCMLMQLAPAEGSERLVLGFGLYNQGDDIRTHSYQWLPHEDSLREPAKFQMSKQSAGTYYYFVKHQNGPNICYELALRHTTFGQSATMKAGDTLRFSFAVSLFSSEPDPTQLGENKRYYMEWGKGIIGGDEQGGINGAGVLTLGAATAAPTTTVTPTTTAAPTTSTTRATTTAATTTGTTTAQTTVDTAPSSTPTSTAIPTEGGEVTTTKDTTTAVTTTVADKAADTTSGSDKESGFPWGILLAVAAVAAVAIATWFVMKKRKA